MVDVNSLNEHKNSANNFNVNEIEYQLSLIKHVPWFHGILSRKDAEKKILRNGDFLLRMSSENKFVVSTKWNDKHLHVVIKNDFDPHNQRMTYQMVSQFRFTSIKELINSHIMNQYKILSSSDAVLCNGVCNTDISKKEHKFRKSVRVFSKLPTKVIPRAGSEIMLAEHKSMETFSQMNKSLTELSTIALDEPTKITKKGFNWKFGNKFFHTGLRSNKINKRNEKSDKENSVVDDDYQSCENGNIAHRVNTGRGLLLDALPLKMISVDYLKSKSTIEENGVISRSNDTLKRCKKNNSSMHVQNCAMENDSVGDQKEAYNTLKLECTSKNRDTGVIDYALDTESTNILPKNNQEDTDSTINLTFESSFVLDSAPNKDYKIKTTLNQPLKRGGSSIYVVPNIVENNTENSTVMESDFSDKTFPIHGLTRGKSSIYVLPKDVGDKAPKTTFDVNCTIKRNESIYVIPIETTKMAPNNHFTRDSLNMSLKLGSFLNLELSNVPLRCCGPIDSSFDAMAINRATRFLLSNRDHHVTLCSYLLMEIQQIFSVVCSNARLLKPGFRCLFLSDSEQFQRELSVRQSVLTSFVIATIVCIGSNESRMKLMIFWIKCADNILTRTRDMFHFRSVVMAIFSDQISRLPVWESLYKCDPSMLILTQSFRKAVSDGCFLSMEIEKCIPDIVQLYNTFTNDDNDDNFEAFSDMCVEIMQCPSLSFEEIFSSRIKPLKELGDNVINQTIPFLRELVQTETLLCLVIGQQATSPGDVNCLLNKVDNNLRSMASMINI